MKPLLPLLATVVCLIGLAPAPVARGQQDEADKERRQLRGVWQEAPPKGKGRGGYATLVFNGDRLLWVLTHTQDGEPLSGVSMPCTYRVDPKASPKAMTVRRWDRKDFPAQLAVYELKGDTLRLCVGADEHRPAGFDAKEGRVYILTRDRRAKVPALDWERQRPVLIRHIRQWLGRVPDRAALAQSPRGPITTREAFEKLWKAWRDKEEVPRVDFAREFVVVRTTTLGTLTSLDLKQQPDGMVVPYTHGAAREGERSEGFAYAIAVFPRHQVDVVDGKIVPRK